MFSSPLRKLKRAIDLGYEDRKKQMTQENYEAELQKEEDKKEVQFFLKLLKTNNYIYSRVRDAVADNKQLFVIDAVDIGRVPNHNLVTAINMFEGFRSSLALTPTSTGDQYLVRVWWDINYSLAPYTL